MGQNRRVRDARIVVYTVNVLPGEGDGLAKVIVSFINN